MQKRIFEGVTMERTGIKKQVINEILELAKNTISNK